MKAFDNCIACGGYITHPEWCSDCSYTKTMLNKNGDTVRVTVKNGDVVDVYVLKRSTITAGR